MTYDDTGTLNKCYQNKGLVSEGKLVKAFETTPTLISKELDTGMNVIKIISIYYILCVIFELKSEPLVSFPRVSLLCGVQNKQTCQS